MRTETDKAIEVRGLRKSYGKLEAVKGVDLEVNRGEIFGLLGHNGAGKSTTIECVLGTREKDSGTVSVLGMDPAKDRKRLFGRVGVQFQQSAFQDKLRVEEACAVASSLYARGGAWEPLLARFGLSEKKKTYVNELSGGERQKLVVAIALIPGPELLLLDELTTGLDPQARRDMWRYLAKLRDDGVTILLTSHYMDEVEFLCDRIAIMKNGILAAEGTPESLIAGAAHLGAKNLEDVFLMHMEKETV